MQRWSLSRAFPEAQVAARIRAPRSEPEPGSVRICSRRGLRGAGCQKATAGLNHLVDEEGLIFAFGLELIAQAGGEFVEVFSVLVREHVEDSTETVTGRVMTGDLFPFRRFRAGGLSGILPVREDLCCGAHFSLSTFILSSGSKESWVERARILAVS